MEIEAILNFIQILIILFAIFANMWITNSHIDRVEERIKKYIDDKLKLGGKNDSHR